MKSPFLIVIVTVLAITLVSSHADAWVRQSYCAATDSVYSIIQENETPSDLPAPRIDRYSFATESWEVFYDTKGRYVGRVECSASGRYMGIKFYNGTDHASLYLMDATQQKINELEEVLEFRWHPALDIVALVRGFDVEGSCQKIYKGTGYYDLRHQEYIEIPVVSHDLAWAEFDGRLYIDHSQNESEGICQVSAFDLVSQNLEPREYMGVYHSPDGSNVIEYWLAGCAVYPTNGPIAPRIFPPMLQRLMEGSESIHWIDSESFVLKDWSGKVYIVHANSQRIVRTDGYFVGLDSSSDEIVIRQEDKTLKKVKSSAFQETTVEVIEAELKEVWKANAARISTNLTSDES